MGDRKYKFARKIAMGGMAEVLLAVQQGLAGFEKLVVLKRVLPHLCQDNQFIQMFLAEARLAASLSHPNIVKIFDVERQDDTFVIVMEYLSGEDLRYLLSMIAGRRQNIPVPIICRIAADLSAGLHHAHTATDLEGNPRGVVHRDVAPGNIIVSYDGVTSLVDFGVAKANVNNIYTRPGTLKGKFGYASPEQIQHLELDARSDVFSLGVVIYELLTAARLFRRNTEAAVLKAVMEAPIEPPSKLNPDIPPELDELVLRALHRDRDERFQSAEEFRLGLETIGQSLDAPMTTHAVADWMQDAFAERHAKRKKLEQSLTLEARGDDDWVSSSQLDPMFSSLSTHSGAGPARSIGAQPNSAVSQSNVSNFSAVQPMAAQPAQRGRGGLLILLTVVGTLLAVAVVGIAYWAGGRGDTEQAKPPEVAVGGAAGGQAAARPVAPTPAAPVSPVAPIAPAPVAPVTPMVKLPPEPERPKAPKTRSRAAARRYRTLMAKYQVAKVKAQREREAAKKANEKIAAERRAAEKKAEEQRTLAKKAEAQRAAAQKAADQASGQVAAQRAVQRAEAARRAEAAKRAAAQRAEAAKRAAAQAAATKHAKATTGRIRILSDSPGYVFVDGKNIGRMTPVRLRLPAGPHTIVVQLKGSGQRITKTIQIKAGKSIRLRLTN
ncbi:MAG: serine/threonine protein kinase [Deltaproteobacteria bacterium]|nr:serine/threonine protein kinase [Deltaproteobacteria bacterium]